MRERHADEAATRLLELCRRKRLPDTVFINVLAADIELLASEYLKLRSRVPCLCPCDDAHEYPATPETSL